MGVNNVETIIIAFFGSYPMPYRIITYRIENDRLLEDYSQEHHLHIEETEKAVLVFEADMIVCRLFIDFTDAHLCKHRLKIGRGMGEILIH